MYVVPALEHDNVLEVQGMMLSPRKSQYHDVEWRVPGHPTPISIGIPRKST